MHALLQTLFKTNLRYAILYSIPSSLPIVIQNIYFKLLLLNLLTFISGISKRTNFV